MRLLCQVLHVVPGCYYAWCKQAAKPAASTAPVAWEAALEKAFTRHVVGWQVRETMPEQPVLNALGRALLSRMPAAGLLVHSDRGGQYCGNAYRALRAEHGRLRS